MTVQMPNILPTTILSPTKDQIASELGGEAVILNLASGMYYGLNEIGARIWELIQQPCAFDSIFGVLIEEYDVDPDICKQDLIKILVEMEAASLIEVSNGTAE